MKISPCDISLKTRWIRDPKKFHFGAISAFEATSGSVGKGPKDPRA